MKALLLSAQFRGISTQIHNFLMSKNVFVLCVALFVSQMTFAQGLTLPSAKVKTLEGQSIEVKDLAPADRVTVFSFWATWCKPCIQELDAIKDLYPDWKTKYNVELVAVSVDDARTQARVKPFSSSKGWVYTIVSDAAKEFQQAANVTNPPLTMVVNGKGEITYLHLGYAPGDEIELEEKVKTAAGK
jgi:cytochrome c biogenesis protein CcmG, thiol:disulfide interchange protein DsbE